MTGTQRTAVFLTILTLAGPSAAQDSMIGYKAKDDVLPTSQPLVYRVDQGGLCKLKKAKYLLESASVDGSAVGTPSYLLCYSAKCEDDMRFTDPIDGLSPLGVTHALDPKKPKLLCVPYDGQLCGDGELDPGETCDGASGATCAGGCGTNCACTPTACGATTGGFCWYLGALGASCEQTCAANGRPYNAATATYAGSGGSDANCGAVLTALAAPGSFIGGLNCSAFSIPGIGCYAGTTFNQRCTLPPTDAPAFTGSSRRVCACG